MLLAAQRCLQVLQRGLHTKWTDLGHGFATHLADDSGMVAGMNLFGPCGRPKEARSSVHSLGFGSRGISLVADVRVQLALIRSEQIADSAFILSSNHSSHRLS